MSWGGAFLAALISSACGPQGRATPEAALQVIGGRALTVDDDLSRSVVALVSDDGVSRTTFGSAVVVGRRTLLTAAHNFLDAGFASGRDEVAFDGIGGPVVGVRARISNVTFHPAWEGTVQRDLTPAGLRIPAAPPGPVGDLAVVTLSTDLPSHLMVVEVDTEGGLSSTDVLHAVGYGWTQEPALGGEGRPGLVPSSTLYRPVGMGRDDTALELRTVPVNASAGVCDGDSGGPLFKETRDASGAVRRVLVGILSRTLSPTGWPGCAGQFAVHTSLKATEGFWRPLLK
jgi:hypothetical protein